MHRSKEAYIVQTRKLKGAKRETGKGGNSNGHRHLGRWSSTLVGCPECREQMTVRHIYSKHAAPKHNLDCRKQGLLCFGRKHWTYGQKNRPENVNNITACLQHFVEDAKINKETEEKETEE
ncbi:uncharacterized protein TNCV_3187671 [Trichonephila clavipes]|nr:uncharacterized protein TNCV_3187671 [Trichonephila clavipes]